MNQAVTLLCPDYETATLAAKQLGFWKDPEPIYDFVETGETTTHYHYVDTETGEPHSFTYLPEGNELVEEGVLVPADPFTTEEPVLNWQQVGMSEGRVAPGGQSTNENGVAYSWSIDEIGLDPVVISGTYDEEGNQVTPSKKLQGYAVNAIGQIPEAALIYAIPYGSAGRTFSGYNMEPHQYIEVEGSDVYVTAVPA